MDSCACDLLLKQTTHLTEDWDCVVSCRPLAGGGTIARGRVGREAGAAVLGRGGRGAVVFAVVFVDGIGVGREGAGVRRGDCAGMLVCREPECAGDMRAPDGAGDIMRVFDWAGEMRELECAGDTPCMLPCVGRGNGTGGREVLVLLLGGPPAGPGRKGSQRGMEEKRAPREARAFIANFEGGARAGG